MNTTRVYVKQSELGIGLGVFASTDLDTGELIEKCPIIHIPADQVPELETSVFYDYYYGWEGKAAALALGYGSLYNHSYTPNAQYQKNSEQNTIDITAISPIKTGQEIFVNYNGDPHSQTKLWFQPIQTSTSH